MPGWTGTIVNVLTSASSNSGFLDLGVHLGIGSESIAIRSATILVDPSGHTGAETTALDLDVAWDSSGTGGVKVHDFTLIDVNDTDEILILPGGDSAGLLFNELGTNAGILGAPIPQFWKITWTVDGATERGFTVYASINYEF